MERRSPFKPRNMEHRPPLKPPSLSRLDQDGSREKWEQFEQEFDQYLVDSGLESMDDAVKCPLLRQCIGRENMHIYDSFYTLHELKTKFSNYCKRPIAADSVQKVDGDPSVQNVDGDPSEQNVDGNPSVQNVDGNPSLQKVDGNASVQNVDGNPSVQKVGGNQSVQNVDGNRRGDDVQNIDENHNGDGVKKVDKNHNVDVRQKNQRSPLNQEGKITYDRNFLLQFSSNCVSKPQGLRNFPDIILHKPAIMSSAERNAMGNTVLDFSPDFVLQTASNPPQSSNKQSRDGGQSRGGGLLNRGGPQQNIHHIGDVLNTVASKPKCNIDMSNKKTTEEIYKYVKGILKKITPENFKTLSKEVQELNIDTETRLKGVTDLIFEKAVVSEPAFSVAYANVCRDLMHHVRVPSDSNPGEKIDCRIILFSKCQREFFEKDKDVDLETGQKKLDEPDSEEMKKQLQEEMEIAATSARRRSIGNIRFLGELCILKMFKKTVVRDCVSQLLQSKDEINLECLSILLTIIGKELDTENAKSEMDQYFQEIQEIITENKTSPRVQLMLQDVIDLRSCNWVPRREDNNPKTIDQIHKEAAKETEQTNFFQSHNVS